MSSAADRPTHRPLAVAITTWLATSAFSAWLFYGPVSSLQDQWRYTLAAMLVVLFLDMALFLLWRRARALFRMQITCGFSWAAAWLVVAWLCFIVLGQWAKSAVLPLFGLVLGFAGGQGFAVLSFARYRAVPAGSGAGAAIGLLAVTPLFVCLVLPLFAFASLRTGSLLADAVFYAAAVLVPSSATGAVAASCTEAWGRRTRQ
jgi:hypothetical protein